MAIRCASSTSGCSSANSRSASPGRRHPLEIVGTPPRADGRTVIAVGPDQTREVRAVVTHYSGPTPVDHGAGHSSMPTDTASGERTAADDHFHGLEEH